jgi:inhibitor of cysteine peptidase
MAGAMGLALGLAATGEKAITLTAADDGRRIETTVGAVLTLRLPARPGSGYSWLVERIDERRTKELGSSTFERAGEPGRAMGGPAFQVFRFEARAAGRSKLVLHYRRPWEKDAPPSKTFTVEIDTR